MARYVGIHHRVKNTAAGKSRPTLVAILEEDGQERGIELSDDTAELDFVLGCFPLAYRPAVEGEDLSAFRPHQIKYTGKGESQKISVPAYFDGIQTEDLVGTLLGGSGDRMAAGISRRGREEGIMAFRIPAFRLSADDPNIIHRALARALRDRPEDFYHVGARDRSLIRVKEYFVDRRDSQKDRIACGQRLIQRTRGRVYLSEEGGWPEGSLEDLFDEARANDDVYQGLLGAEKDREMDLRKAVRDLDIWKTFEKVEGCGEVIAAGIIAAVGDIRRFSTKAKFKAYLGSHVLSDGSFPRKRHGEVANWSKYGRQALYLLADQWVKRPDSEWGKRYRHYKVVFRNKYPEPVIGENGKKRYTNGHIHKMAIWRTITKFAEWLYLEWLRVEGLPDPREEKQKAWLSRQAG